MNFFSENILDRSSELRTDTKCLTEIIGNANTKFLLFKNSQPLVENRDDGKRLCIFTYDTVKEIILLVFNEVRNLGNAWPSDLLFLGKERNEGSFAWFAVSISNVEESLYQSLLTEERYFVKNKYDLLNFFSEHASIISQAKSMFHWLDRYRFCPTCGAKMITEEAGYKRTCVDAACRSNKGIYITI